MRRLKVRSERCIHTHPIKRDSDIRTALAYGVNRFVIDNPDELRKFVQVSQPRRSLLIRVSFSSPDARCDLSRKFGCEPEAVAGSVAAGGGVAHQDRRIVVSRRIAGGRPRDVRRGHRRAAASCCARRRGRGTRSGILDIGGGFPVRLSAALHAHRGILCANQRRAAGSFPPTLRVIAEPGRYISAPAAIAVASVMGRALRGERWWYYLDDGLYGSYSGQIYDHAAYPVEALVPAGKTYPSVLAGPDLRQHRCHQRESGIAQARRGRSGRRPRNGRLYLGLGLGIQFLSAGHGAGARRRTAAQRQEAADELEPAPCVASGRRAGRACRRPAFWRAGAQPETQPGDAAPRRIALLNLHTERAAGRRILSRGRLCAGRALGH